MLNNLLLHYCSICEFMPLTPNCLCVGEGPQRRISSRYTKGRRHYCVGWGPGTEVDRWQVCCLCKFLIMWPFPFIAGLLWTPLPRAISGVLGSGIGNGSMLNASSFFNRITELLFLKTQGTVATDEWSYFSTIQTMTPSSSAWMGPISTQNFPPRNISTKWKTTSSRIRTCVEHPALDLTWPLIIFGRITVRVLGLLVLPIKIWHVTI